MGLLYTIISIICLIFGFYSGYKIGKEQRLPEEIKPTRIIKKYKRHKKEIKDEKQQEEQIQKLQKDLEIIDSYNAGL